MGADLLLTWCNMPKLPDGTPATVHTYNAETNDWDKSEYADRMIAQAHARVDALTDDELNTIIEDAQLEAEYVLDIDPDSPDAEELMRDYVRKQLHKHVDTYFGDGLSYRDIAPIVIGGQPVLMTGGMSWGDEPSYSFSEISLLGNSGVTDFVVADA